MYEVEMKVQAAHEPVRAALEREGARSLGRVEQVDVYFDAPHRDFAARDEALRLREETDPEGTITALTYKGPKVDATSKTRQEFETTVGSREKMQAALSALGFEPAATVEKTRERFELDGIVVSLDTVSGLGQFVEAEAEATEADIETTRDTVTAVLSRLDLDPEAQIRRSYLGLLLDD
ncbi:MAG: class IV adenylate cyclase [Halobacteriota archaeon]